MALNDELIKANETLKDLTPEQITAITELSTNDEKVVIGTRIGELHQRYEDDIREITGVEKASDTEKGYEYQKRILKQYKGQIESSAGLKKEVDTLNSKITDYEKQIAAGNTDTVLAQKLKDAETALVTATEELSTTKQTLTANETKHAQDLKNNAVQSAYNKAKATLEFKKEFSAISDKLTKTANVDILEAYTPDFEEVEGKQVLIFRDKQGNKALNKTNGLKPYTYEELLKKELGSDILGASAAAGTGTKKPENSGTNDSVLDLSGATSQVQADEAIVVYLMQKGIVRGSAKFAEEQSKIRTENNIDKLPIK